MKTRALYVLLCIFPVFLGAQKASAQSIDSLKLDSLIFVLTLDKKDSSTVDAYLSLAKEYENVSEYTIALTYSDLAFDMARKIHYKEAEFESAYKIAHVYLAYSLDFENALRHYDEALKIAEELRDDEKILSVYSGYSSLYASVKQYDEAIHFNQKGIELAKKIGDEQLVSSLNAYGGNMYEENGDTSKAIEMYEEVLRIEEANNYVNSSKASLATIAHYYHLIGDLEKSLDQYRSALKRFERLKDNRWVSYIHAEMAKVYIDAGNLGRAEKHALKGYEIALQYELNKERGDNLYVLAEVYEAMGKDKKANEYRTKFNNLMDSVQVELTPRGSIYDKSNPEASPAKSTAWYSGFISAIIICLMIGIMLVGAGILYRNR